MYNNFIKINQLVELAKLEKININKKAITQLIKNWSDMYDYEILIDNNKIFVQDLQLIGEEMKEFSLKDWILWWAEEIYNRMFSADYEVAKQWFLFDKYLYNSINEQPYDNFKNWYEWSNKY